MALVETAISSCKGVNGSRLACVGIRSLCCHFMCLLSSSLGQICLLEIDLVGVSIIRSRHFKGARFVFIEPPSLEELERRLRQRNTETPETVSPPKILASVFACMYTYVSPNLA